jgi:hypothetical protein
VPQPSPTTALVVARTWGPEVFAEARTRRRPVLLVVGRPSAARDRRAVEAAGAVLQQAGGDRVALFVDCDVDAWPEVADYVRTAATAAGVAPVSPMALLVDADVVPRGVVSGEREEAEWTAALRTLLEAAPPSEADTAQMLETLRRAQRPAAARRPLTRDQALAAAARVARQDVARLSIGAILLLTAADEAVHLPGARDVAVRALASGPTGATGDAAPGLEAWRLVLVSRLAPSPGSALAAAGQRAAERLVEPQSFADVNGLAIMGLALGGSRLGRPDDVAAAQRIASATLERLGPPRALKHGLDGERSLGPARLGDYAALGLGLLTLHEVTGKRDWLVTAQSLADAAIGALWDADGEGFFLAPRPPAPLPVRVKSGFDGEIPSANATMALFLGALAERSGRADYRDLARRTVQAFAGDIETAPSGMESLLAAAIRVLPEAPPVASTAATPTAAPAAPSRVVDGPLVLELRAERTSLRPGEGTELFLRLQPSVGFVVTPHSTTERGVVPLSVALLEPDLAADPPTYGPATLSGAYDGAMVPIRIPRSAPEGARRARVSVRAQACTAGGDCRPPIRVTLEVALTVSVR